MAMALAWHGGAAQWKGDFSSVTIEQSSSLGFHARKWLSGSPRGGSPKRGQLGANIHTAQIWQRRPPAHTMTGIWSILVRLCVHGMMSSVRLRLMDIQHKFNKIMCAYFLNRVCNLLYSESLKAEHKINTFFVFPLNSPDND
jgi:hypothetical protein